MLPELAVAAAVAGFLPAPLHSNVHIGDFQYPSGGDVGMVGGYTNPSTGDIYMQERDPFALAHEKFHLLDYQSLSDAERGRLQRAMNMTGAWDQGVGVTGGMHSPSEWAADYYAAGVTGLNLNRQVVSSYATIGPKRLKRFKRELKRISRDHPELVPYKR